MSRDPGAFPDPQFHAFEAFFRVRFHEVDALGHLNNAAYLNYLEQAAIDHATYLGLDLPRLQELGGVFVARRHEIVFVRPTFAETCCESSRGWASRGERASTATIWYFASP